MQRLAGAEEVLGVPDNRSVDSSINKEIANSVQACLLKVNLNIFLKFLRVFFFVCVFSSPMTYL